MDTKKLNHAELEAAFKEALRGMARVQARQEMMECVIRALIVQAKPLHPVIRNALHTAKLDLDMRTTQSRGGNLPEFDADVMKLLNVLLAACEPPKAGANES